MEGSMYFQFQLFPSQGTAAGGCSSVSRQAALQNKIKEMKF